jgi:hypothetical protein
MLFLETRRYQNDNRDRKSEVNPLNDAECSRLSSKKFVRCGGRDGKSLDQRSGKGNCLAFGSESDSLAGVVRATLNASQALPINLDRAM